MIDDQIQVGQAQAYSNVSGSRILKYTVEMFHKGLNEHKLLSAPAIDMLQNKVNLQAQKWMERWVVIESKHKILELREANVEEANSRTDAARKALNHIRDLLVFSLPIDDAVDWEKLKKKENYSEKTPAKPVKAKYKEYPPAPAKKAPTLTLLDKIIFKSRKERKIKEAETNYKSAILKWGEDKKAIDAINRQIDIDFDEIEIKKWENDVLEWERRQIAFLKDQDEFNAKIENMKELYLAQNTDSIHEYCDMVLSNSIYPDSFPQNYELEYNPDNKILIIEYELPSIECFPKVKEVKYVASRNELRETYIPESEINRMFDEAMYKITLRSIHELFEADVVNAIDAVSFNGWIKSINKATGKEETNCILIPLRFQDGTNPRPVGQFPCC